MHGVRSEENVADLGLRFSFQVAAAGSRQKCTATGANVVAAASIGKLLGMPKMTLRFINSVSTHRPNSLRKVQTGRLRTSSSEAVRAKRLRCTELTTNLYRTPRITTLIFARICTSKPEVFGKMHRSTDLQWMASFSSRNNMRMEPSYSYTATKVICKASSCALSP